MAGGGIFRLLLSVVALMIDLENNKGDEASCESLLERDEEFERKMERGYADAIEGRGKPMEDVFSDLSKRFI